MTGDMWGGGGIWVRGFREGFGVVEFRLGGFLQGGGEVPSESLCSKDPTTLAL